MSIKLECAHADTCLSDYWSGHHLPHVQIYVYNGMSLKDVKEAIKQELIQGYIMGNSDDARLLSADVINPGEEKRADQLTKAAYAAVNRMRPAKRGARNMFPDLEKGFDHDIYAYFVFVEID